MALPTVITRTVGTGKTHATVALWEDATDTDLVAANTIEVGEMYGSFTAGATLAGATVDPGHFRVLMAAPGHEYDPITDTGVKIVDGAAASTLAFTEANSVCRGMLAAAGVARNAGQGAFVGFTNGGTVVERCVAVDLLSTNDAHGFFDISVGWFARNCIAIGKDAANGMMQGFRGNGSLARWYRCVAYSCKRGSAPEGFQAAAESLGCVAIDNTLDFNATAGESYAASLDASAGGTGSITGVTAAAAFRNAAANDFRPPAGAPTVDKSVPFVPPFKPFVPVVNTSLQLADDLVLCHVWHDRVANVASDISGKANHCTLAAGAGDAAWSRHFPGATVSMDGGAAQPMLVTQAASLPLATAPGFTIALWINPATVAAGVRALWTEQNVAQTTFYSLLASAAAVGLRVTDSVNGALEDTTSGTTDLVALRWHHVAIVDNGGLFTIYVDGLPKHTGVYAKASLDAASMTVTAPFGSLGTAWTGHNGSVMAWRRPLSIGEIKRLAQGHPWEIIGGSPPTDFAGALVPQGASLDMGAYELQLASSSSSLSEGQRWAGLGRDAGRPSPLLPSGILPPYRRRKAF